MKRSTLLTCAFIEGGLVMLLELTTPHLVTPVFGNSIHMWAILLCLAVLSLAIGYFIGGPAIKNTEKNAVHLRRFFLFSLGSIVLGYIFLLLLNSSQVPLGDQTLVYTIIGLTIVLPLIAFGATTPLIIKLIQKNNQFEAGKVFSYSTVGGLTLALITGFIFLPELGISKTFLIAILLDGVCLLLLFRGVKRMVAIGSMLVIAVSFIMMLRPFQLPTSGNMMVHYMEEGLNGQLMVSDVKNDSLDHRILFINRMGQTWIDQKTGFSSWSYPNLLTAIGSLYPENSKTLLLGLGGGIVAKQLREFTGHQVDAVELDQRIIDIAYDYFKLPSYGIQAYNEDARTFLNRSQVKYDFIVFDIFNGEIAPSHGLSAEAFEKAKQSLSKNGLIAINFNGFETGIESESGKSLIATLKAAGFKVKYLPTVEKAESDRNIIYLAYLNEPDWQKITITINTDEGQFLIHEKLKQTDKSSGRIVTDDFPIMEQLNLPAARTWRKSYYENFTLKYKKEYGINYIK